MTQTNHFPEFEFKMKQAEMGDAILRAFRHSYSTLFSENTGMLPESVIQPVTDLPRLECGSSDAPSDKSLLAQTVILKLNGGLGTSMGLAAPKSLLVVKDGMSFLDIIAKQVLHARRSFDAPLHFMLMNSFSTSVPTLEWLARHPDLGQAGEIELMQNSIPKVDTATLRPVAWPASPELEWCPPGHGDLYPSVLGSGWLDRLLNQDCRYLFVSNADNLGATLDLNLLNRFAASNQSFLMEVCERTTADKKGGHLAMRGGHLLLRESAQCPKSDEAAFQDISRHRFFNTNNLWLRLDHLKQALDRNGGFLPLPVIHNSKTVDPRDAASPKVIQLETAMGAAIECFEDVGAIVVPRSRFAPVKTTSDLLAVRSDAYTLTEDFQVQLRAERNGKPPAIALDSKHYKLVDQLEASLTGGVPSLRDCESLRVEGPVCFQSGNVFRGKVSVYNSSATPATMSPRPYEDIVVTL